jgi:hypothetical protein
MALFRWHRGSLDDSLSTTIIVKSHGELTAKLWADWEPWLDVKDHEDVNFEVNVAPYPMEDHCFDPRCGWYTQIVTCKFNGKKLGPAGYLSEPFLEAVKIPLGKSV